MSSTKPQAILVNVGGATNPAIHTLNEQQPPFICFFVSADSKPLIRSKILPALNYTPEHYDWIETPVPQSLLECYRVLADGLPLLLNKWKLTPEALGVEYTAGTKPMSVAAVLATIETSSAYYYVGSKDPSGRDRGGIGIVLDGWEATWFQSNPWEALSVRAQSEIAFLFNHNRFADAQERAHRLSRVAPEEMRKVFQALAELIEGYALWDRFEYRAAQSKIYRALSSLQLYVAGRDVPLSETLRYVERNAQFLRDLNQKTQRDQRLDLLDMLANATRRAEMAQKYDDAVARLYSSLEALARNRLDEKYNIRTNAVQPEQVPEPIRDEYIRLYSDSQNPHAGLRLGLMPGYKLLVALEDELGDKFMAREKELRQVLYSRNQSRLAHGSEPVKPETYEKLRGIIMSFAEITEDELPKFPELRL